MTSEATSTPKSSELEDEYNVFVPNGKHEEERTLDHNIPSIITKNGEVAYLVGSSNSMAERYKLFRNNGDVFVAIDGETTENKTAEEVKAMISISVSTKDFSHFRMRDIKASTGEEKVSVPVKSSEASSTTDKDGQLPMESKKQEIQQAIDALANSLSGKETEIRVIQKEVLELKRELHSKQREMEALHEQDEKWLEKKLDEIKSRKSRTIWQAMSFQ